MISGQEAVEDCAFMGQAGVVEDLVGDEAGEEELAGPACPVGAVRHLPRDVFDMGPFQRCESLPDIGVDGVGVANECQQAGPAVQPVPLGGPDQGVEQVGVGLVGPFRGRGPGADEDATGRQLTDVAQKGTDHQGVAGLVQPVRHHGQARPGRGGREPVLQRRHRPGREVVLTADTGVAETLERIHTGTSKQGGAHLRDPCTAGRTPRSDLVHDREQGGGRREYTRR
jgi:hypothetical protein